MVRARVAATLVALLPALLTQTASATSANPIADGPWGVYKGPVNGVWPAYETAVGYDKLWLGKIALQPRVRWFGGWVPDDEIEERIRGYVSETQDGDKDALVQLSTFRIWVGGEKNKLTPLTYAQRTSYRRWYDGVARGIGSSRVAVVLEPDLGITYSGWGRKVRLRLTRYAATVLGSLPRTTVYIDAGDSDWLTVDKAAAMLLRAGVERVRGFALGATHYTSNEAATAYGRKIVRALRIAGVPGRRFVIDTADNGHPFTGKQMHEFRPDATWGVVPACESLEDTVCVSLGHPPTSDTGSAYVDGYLWFGRPWLVDGSSTFSLSRAVAIASTSPY